MTNDEGTPRQRRKRTNDLLRKQAIGLDKVSKRRLEELKHTNMVAFNDTAVRKFIELIRSLIERNDLNGINILEVYREAAYEIGISIETAKRYLIAHSASRAEFMMFGRLVMLNPNYQPRDDEEGGDTGE